VISVILYGRNDSYGYNLHKRAALSLNCLAEVLDAPGDEIIFVDYNTPDDFPTFPEAIQDTLTPRARSITRVLRLRPAQHRRFAAHSHLVALEPIARNVALRRANPANRWVLSTNTDMILAPRHGASLSQIAAALPDGFYGLPRFELPETLWEALDRSDPAATIARVAAWGTRFHLNEIVTLDQPAIGFDAPGDFQLMLRAELADIHGFDERMLLGWHVDSNIAVRLGLRHGPVGDLTEQLFGYHCDHTRQVTPAHRHGARRNDMDVFVHQVRQPRPPGQENWGLAGEPIEEIRLDRPPPYLAALEAAIAAPMAEPTRAHYGLPSHGRADYDSAHVVPFLLDAIACYPADTAIGWAGTRPDLLARAAAGCAALGRTGPILVAAHPGLPDAALPRGATACPPADLALRADILVFDFALTDALRANPAAHMADDPAVAFVTEAFLAAIAAEQARGPNEPPRRFMAVNAIHNHLDRLVDGRLAVATTPFSTRLRQGFVRRDVPLTPALPDGAPLDLMPRFITGAAGRTEHGRVRPLPGTRGLVCKASLDAAPGRWVWRIEYQPDPGLPRPGPVLLRALRLGRFLAVRHRLLHGLGRQALELPFEMDGAGLAPVELQLGCIGLLRGTFAASTLAPAPR
jgi:hypothetical protein